jgi:hypothetical protein
MVMLGVTGALIGFLKDQPGNIIAGTLTAYMVITAMTTVRPIRREANIAFMLVGLAGGLYTAYTGLSVLAQGKTSSHGVPVAMTFFFASLILSAAFGDIRLLRAGGVIRGSPRIVRHLWRMCVALFIASGSFFSIRKRVAMILPDPFLSLPLRMIPIILPLAAIIYWIWRIKFRKRFTPVRLRDPANA